ncbi:MAG: hypothetical protein U0R19_21600 [Bryobacteraceae bacterium]
MQMERRTFLALAGAMPALGQTIVESQAIEEEHFPSRQYCFVWRNWELVNSERMAAVLGCGVGEVESLGLSMGLPRKQRVSDDQLRRIYITVIRQNWHLLPVEQLVELLGWDRKRFDFTLKEDDFLIVKLAYNKPVCARLRYTAPTSEEKKRAAEIRAVLKKAFGKALHAAGEPSFQFVADLSKPSGRPARRRAGKALWSPRFCYSYFALYGDPLIDPSVDPFPEGYLEKLSECGLDGVWLQGVLNTLAPSKVFREFGEGWETRLKNLRAMCARAGRHGVKVYLYMNEPRAMPAAFFAGREHLKGEESRGLFAMCTSTREVREWLADSLAHVFREVPELGGIVTISMSENHTNCFSHRGGWGKIAPRAKECPRCTPRESWDVLGEMFGAMHEGIRRSSREARIIHWDWGWPDDMADKLIPLLDKDVRFQSISEWSQPLERGGVKSVVGEYSISVPGPGPRARRNWGVAKRAGIETNAKVQFNNTWEISAVPFIPVPHLVMEHCEGLRKEGVSGIMASWTCGGYPSPNLEAAAAYFVEGTPDRAAVLQDVAGRRFGERAAADAVEAWRLFSEAFREFPYGVSIYVIPVQHGPANLLRWKATGHKTGMILFPHDQMKAWCGRYPPEVVQSQFYKMAAMWKQGLVRMKRVVEQASARRVAEHDLAVAETCYCHFQSVAQQVEFYRLRDGAPDQGRMKELVAAEMELARQQYRVARAFSTVAYEATNHYYYRPLDLAEKVVQCAWLESGADKLA